MTLQEYCRKMGISLREFAAMTDIGEATIYNICNLNENDVALSVLNMKKIYAATKKRFGTGLHPSDYINFESYDTNLGAINEGLQSGEGEAVEDQVASVPSDACGDSSLGSQAGEAPDGVSRADHEEIHLISQ